MEPRLTGVNQDEALRYLGCRDGNAPPELRQAISRCRDMILRTARPRAVWRIFPWDQDRPLAGTTLTLQGQDVRDLLRGCDRVILFGATLGAEIEGLLRRAQVRDMAEAVVLDACASAAIENVCENLCNDLQQELGGCLTERYSPGYGDLPLSQQPEFLSVLDLSRRIGVSLSPGGLMIPQKSVTALLGHSDAPLSRRKRDCRDCKLYASCIHRKEGGTCE